MARRLVDLLREQRRVFPGFAGRIDQFIATIETDSKRTRSYDREKVLQILRVWQCGIGVRELMEDTGYSHWDIRMILKDLIERELVTQNFETRQGRRVAVYRAI